MHPLSGRELRALRRLKREQNPPPPFVFTSERGAPFAIRGFGRWSRGSVKLLGSSTGCIRSCGMQRAGQSRDHLGHRNIQHTVRYTKLSESKFKNLWPD